MVYAESRSNRAVVGSSSSERVDVVLVVAVMWFRLQHFGPPECPDPGLASTVGAGAGLANDTNESIGASTRLGQHSTAVQREALLSKRRRAHGGDPTTEEDTMERVPWDSRLRHAGIARRLVIAAVAALALAVVAAAGMAATNRGSAVPANTKPPVVSGTAEVGKELTTTNGTWSGTTPLEVQLPVAPLRQDRRRLRQHLRRDRQHVQGAGGRRGQHAACRRHRQEQRRQRQRDQRPDRGRPRHAGIEQRLSGRQEREDRPDRRARTARAAPDRRLRRAVRSRSTSRRRASR